MEDCGAGILRRRAVERLSHVNRLIREPTRVDRHDCQHETVLGIERHQHLVGRDRDRVAAFDAALDLDEMQMPGLGIAAFDVVADLGGRHVTRLAAQRAFGGEHRLHRKPLNLWPRERILGEALGQLGPSLGLSRPIGTTSAAPFTCGGRA